MLQTHNIHTIKLTCIQLISTVVNRNWTDIARYGNLESWRELLAALVTYAGPEDFAPLCGEGWSVSGRYRERERERERWGGGGGGRGKGDMHVYIIIMSSVM